MAGIAVAAAVIAWRTHGSLAGPDWLPLAVLVALIGATVPAARAAFRPPPLLVAGAGGLATLAAWTAVSISWAPSPAGARDEALLVALYAVVLLIPGLALAGETGRRAGLATVLAVLAILGVVSAVDLATAKAPAGFFFFGRFDFPVSYVNAASALFVLGLWPALALGARREGSIAGRAAALGAGGLLLAFAVSAQSKGTVVGLVVSAVALFALSPWRMRLLLPIVAVAAPAAALAVPLTAPYRSDASSAANGVGTWSLVSAVAAGLLGAVYAYVDRRVDVPAHARRLAGRILLGAVVLAVVAVVAGFFATVHAPGQWAHTKWTAFKHPGGGGSSTHLTALGSNRYDFWRVALDETRLHPLRGLGGRGFYNAYLQQRRSPETPLRAHSLYLDTLSEEGIPGLLLLLFGLGSPLVLLARRLGSATALGAFGALVYFMTHAAVDWIWTVPVVGVFALLLAGVGAAGEGEFPVARRASWAAAAVGVLLAIFAFAPPWLAHKYVTSAYRSSAPDSDLSTARTLDPLSLDPDWAEWRLATTPAAKIAALQRARKEEPSSVAVLYQLGLVYQQQGDRTAARDAFRRAHALDPLDAAIRSALSSTAH